LDVGCWMLDVGCWMLDVGCWMLDPKSKIRDYASTNHVLQMNHSTRAPRLLVLAACMALAAQSLPADDAPRVLESILQPSREIAPHYVPSSIQTSDGRVLEGLWLGYDDQANRERFLASDGKEFMLDPDSIEARSASSVSIMPADLHKQLTLEEIRDLLALLSK